MAADIIIVKQTNNIVGVSATGPQGPAGSGSVHQYTQSTPSASWVIVHNLGRAVSAEVFLNTGEEVITDVINTSTSTLTINFASVQSGYVLYS